MNERLVTVFGGTGFLGRRVVRSLAAAGHRVRVAARKPTLAAFADIRDQLTPVVVDIRDERSVAEAVAGAAAVVNAVSLYVEKGGLTFETIHIEGAERVARCAQAAGADRLVHISGIGVEAHSPSKFVRARAKGEQVVRRAFERSTLVRPSVMFGWDDAFLNAIEQVTRLPVVPLFGRGDNRLQPAYVKDVAAAVARLSEPAYWQGELFEVGGGRIYTYREAVQTVMAHRGRDRPLVSVPFSLWNKLVTMLSLLPNPPLTRDQLILMQTDNVVGDGVNTFAELDIEPQSLDSLLDQCFPQEGSSGAAKRAGA